MNRETINIILFLTLILIGLCGVVAVFRIPAIKPSPSLINKVKAGYENVKLNMIRSEFWHVQLYRVFQHFLQILSFFFVSVHFDCGNSFDYTTSNRNKL